ncbi:CPBP family intramembrane glutamic endopeptidase [Promicromonospora sukumoe]|uniref:Membrane protease YdiL (CAAX protease family) n=1 Tax=Promicromonospora sukumoe TaxID=88382 RepID=A0A7W3JBD3_9MICO|nr:type II CAAX endopeptidase family protein [Promicromonospora sukumoe]MBA8809753.1 membrane protease YdiL (CAAX protease family) [Promicromonospora sukumoe]
MLPSGPREYPQALRGPWFRWWRPLLGLVAIGACIALVFGAMLLYALVWLVASALGTQLPDPSTVTDAWFVSPAGLVVTNLGLALGIPLALVATWAQARRGGLVSSVLGRVRWRLLLGGLGVSLLLLAPLTVGSSILMAQFGAGADAGSGADDPGLWPLTPASGWLVLALVILLTTPLQAAGEEYFFRGWLTQWIGSLLRWRWVALIVPAVVTAVLFAMAHGAQSPWLFADRLVFGLVASLLVWRTGGLEVAVALHVANNLIAFGLAIAYDGLEDSLLITEVAPAEGAVSIAGTLVTTAVLLWWARRRKPTLVVTDPPAPPPGPPGWAPGAGAPVAAPSGAVAGQAGTMAAQHGPAQHEPAQHERAQGETA